MCGIAGFISFENELSTNSINEALRVLNTRGPDGKNVLQLGAATLLHTRLAVIDISNHASQPMLSNCNRYSIVFNGEIYNYQDLRKDIETEYKFSSNSDTEVILAYYIKYGVGMLKYFRGMFAFAIWDKLKDELLVVRDRLGVKPLYYSKVNNDFIFASRPSALTALIPEFKQTIDKQSLRYYLEAGYVPAPFSIFEGIYKLEPGYYLTYSKLEIKKVCYWSASNVAIDESLAHADENNLIDELDGLIEESVKLRMVSDVKIGAFLSGGIDSSLVTAYMARNSTQPINTFTIGFKEKSFNESIFAADVAKHLGTNHTCEILSSDDLLGLIPTFIQNYDEPFFDYSAFPVMAVSRLAKKSVTVSLSGDGGDESFGGYHYYSLMKNLQYAHTLPYSIRKVIGRSLMCAPYYKIRLLGNLLLERSPASAFAFMRGVIKDFSNIMQPSLLHSTEPLSSLFTKKLQEFPPGLGFADIGMRLDTSYTLADDYLQKVDIGSMAFSLEARDPLLDHKIVEWAARLPLKFKLRGNTKKYLLRQLAYRYIPSNILERPKMGFSVPMAQWLRGELKPWGAALLEDSQSFEALGINANAVRSIWGKHQSNQLQAHTPLWSVLTMLQFYQANIRK
jgi:asparagine synthase (glutamine-hydrolysing)